MCRHAKYDGNTPLRWRHSGHDSVSNHQPHDCLLNRLLRRRSKKTPKLRVTGFCAGNSRHKWPVTRKMFPFDDVIMVSLCFRTKNRKQPLHRKCTSVPRIRTLESSDFTLSRMLIFVITYSNIFAGTIAVLMCLKLAEFYFTVNISLLHRTKYFAI